MDVWRGFVDRIIAYAIKPTLYDICRRWEVFCLVAEHSGDEDEAWEAAVVCPDEMLPKVDWSDSAASGKPIEVMYPPVSPRMISHAVRKLGQVHKTGNLFYLLGARPTIIPYSVIDIAWGCWSDFEEVRIRTHFHVSSQELREVAARFSDSLARTGQDFEGPSEAMARFRSTNAASWIAAQHGIAIEDVEVLDRRVFPGLDEVINTGYYHDIS